MNRCEKVFECVILAEKSDSISAKTFFFFFFWRPPVFGRKKRLSAFREISSQFSNKPCESDSRTMKIRVKVVCTFLTLSKKPPLFQILATRLVVVSTDNFIASKENSQSKAFRKTSKNGVDRADGFFNRWVASTSKCINKLNVSQNLLNE